MRNKLIFILFLSCNAFSAFDTLNNVPVPESSQPYNEEISYAFLIPNELYPGAFKSYEHFNGLNGLMVSVGSFRTLIIFAWAPNINHLLMLDYNPGIVEFNKDHLSLIRCIAEKYPENLSLQRMQYLAHMHGKALTNIELENVDPVNTYKYVKKLVNDKQKSTDIKGNTDCLEVIENSPALSHATEIIFNQRYNEKLDSKKNFMNLHRTSDQELFYWEDDAQWQKITNAILDNRIASSRINLSLIEDLKSLEKFIKDTNLNFSILDISNVHGHVRPQNLWAENLLESGLRPDIVFMTEFFDKKKPNNNLLSKEYFKDTWNYFALLWNDYLDFLRNY